jgi:polyribonucleotide 5'-hydroxyl-kinase
MLMDRLVRNLGESLDTRNQADPEGSLAGVIVDTPSSYASGSVPQDLRHRLIKACVDAFKSQLVLLSSCISSEQSKVNLILVVGHEKLNVEMQRLYGSSLNIVKIPKSGGVCSPPILPRLSRLSNFCFRWSN